ncbi:hypothetical protein Salat_1783800 [Sesamum alatum]|uniref:Uncharacterized protein n=1 Tax=Sesamum alatum TaxID=300844 RepID=A0AAE2CKW9_9LAMI|nr:hypothetical protein Salat_1783800 [Sesamum alatum]
MAGGPQSGPARRLWFKAGHALGATLVAPGGGVLILWHKFVNRFLRVAGRINRLPGPCGTSDGPSWGCGSPPVGVLAAAIEELEDLSKITMYELIGSLLAYEQNNRSGTPSIKQTFQSKQVPKSSFGNEGEFRGSQSQN